MSSSVQGSSDHLIILGITVFLVIFLVFLSRKSENKTLSNTVGYILAAVLILNYTVYTAYRISTGSWDMRYDLPMELCHWSTIVTVIALINHNRTLSEISFFWVMSGSVHGLITPDLRYFFPHIYFFTFFTGHSVLVIASLYIIFGLKIYPDKRSLFRVILFSELYFISAFLLNYLIDSNYGYLMEKPQAGSILDYLGEWPYYIISIQLIGITAFTVLYAPFYIKNKFKSG